MMHNIKIIFLSLIVLFFSVTKNALNYTDINVTLNAQTIKNVGIYNNEHVNPALYTKSMNYETLFAIADADGNYTKFYDAKLNATFNVSTPSSIQGPNSIIQLIMKNKYFRISNSYSGVLIH